MVSELTRLNEGFLVDVETVLSEMALKFLGAKIWPTDVGEKFSRPDRLI